MKEGKEVKVAEQKKNAIESVESSNILKTDILSPKKITTPKYFCTIKQFAYFVEGTEAKQRSIVKMQKNRDEEEDHPFWYQTPQSSIGKSLKSGDQTPIYEGLTKLKKSAPTGTQSKHNKDLSILALEKYLNFSLPLDFRTLKKLFVKPEKTIYNCLGVEIKVTPDYVFRAEHKGKKIVGAVRVNLNKTKPFTVTRMKVVSFLLTKYLEKHIAKDGEIVLPEFCLCIDVFGGNCVSAPSRTDATTLF